MRKIFSSNIKLDSLLLAYFDKNHLKKSIVCQSKDGLVWYIDDQSFDNICYYGFIVNDSFWICDPNSIEYTTFEGEIFSVGITVKERIAKMLNISSTETGSDFIKENYKIYDKKSIFSNLDNAICFRANIEGVITDSLVILQILDPMGNIFHMSSELLNENKVDGRRVYYAGMRVSDFLVEGTWTFQLVYGDKLLCSEEIKYKVYKNGYRDRAINTKASNQSLINFKC
ncbi:hypothetical protein [Ureibacillus sinduriensis]|uniref:Uncharacterized protein n=1 Tax=Ureibacillus sinduriensis BLB-1 = JCM 15800 TaxID=1384057 RepID=A0A0A3IMU6_9BACL|nr:hypothetical protein [Ureibacillus sinduriensis]KGR76162.1 hypothetical protein CD33_08310 [Ureibacillus sinduriensis BLB-1 = JCM 15800]